MKPIRLLYEKYGVSDYYNRNFASYRNPHEREIKKLIENNIDYFKDKKILDFAAGNGEVTKVLRKYDVKDVVGADPYTFENYSKETGLYCMKLGFEDVIKKKLHGNYDIIISSFGLHLCDENLLHSLVLELFSHAKEIVIITPHKRPQLEKFPGVVLLFEDFVLTDKGKRVRLKVYRKE